MRLDKNTVASLGLPDGASDKIHFDGELSGFGYRVRRSASGALLRSYVAQYRSNGASKRLLIGDAFKDYVRPSPRSRQEGVGRRGVRQRPKCGEGRPAH